MVKQSEKLLESIYKDISNDNFIEAISKMNINHSDIPDSIFHTIYYFMDHIKGFMDDRDKRYNTILTLFNWIKKDTYFLLAKVCDNIVSQNIIKNVLSYSDALHYLDLALMEDPYHTDSLLLYGDILWNQGKIIDSIVQMNKAISIDSNTLKLKLDILINGIFRINDTKTYQHVLKDLRKHKTVANKFKYKYLEGTLLMKVNRNKDAISCFKQALKEPESSQWLITEIKRNLADLYLKAKNFSEAKKQLEELDVHSRFEISLKHKDYKSCLSYAMRALKNSREYMKIEWRFRVAEIYFHLKDYKKAEAAIKPLIKYEQYRHSRYRDFYLYGQILYKQKRYKEALKELEKAILEISKDSDSENNIDGANIRLLMANIYLILHILDQNNDTKSAIKLAMNIKPDSLENINSMQKELNPWWLLLESNRTVEMKKEIKLILSIDRTLRSQTDNLLKKLTDSTNKNRELILKTRIKILRKAINGKIADDNLRRELANLELHFGNPDELLKILETISTNNLNDMVLKAICLQKQGKTNKAIEKLEEIKAQKYINKDQLSTVLSTQIDFYKDSIVDNTDVANIEKLRESFDQLINNEIARFSDLSILSGLHPNFNRATLKGSILYKYKDYNTNTINSILNNYLYFSTPTQLNDPLDIVFEEIHRSKPEAFKYYKVDPNNFGIFSSTMLNNHSLMWSHYSRDHKGLCIGYRIFSLPEFVGWNNINYCPSYKEADDVLSEEGYITNGLSTKTELWSYEKEVRLFCYKQENQKIHYSPNPEPNEIGCEICEIILGYKMDSEAKQSILSIVRSLNDERNRTNRPKIKLFETIRSQLYELGLHELGI